MPEATAHPSEKQLSAYNLGQMSPDEATAIESHIADCEPCCETIVGLSSDDTFVDLLKEARQLPTDKTLDHNGPGAPSTSSANGVPAPLAQHPRYEIVGLIGKGGMGDVYKAQHRRMKRTVALKVINRKMFRQPEAVNRFHREVEAAAQLSHPHIVTSHDADQAGEFHFMVMEYVDGVDLSQVVRDRGALPIWEACDYIRQAALGLQHAHERGMVHRDVKPHNLMLTADGTVKILDFGLASLAPESLSDAGMDTASGDLTVAGSIMGTPDFISPEQAKDARQADIRSDIYSLGATLYFLLTGRPALAGGNVVEKLKSLAESEPESLKFLRKDIPDELATIVMKMLAKDPDQRHQTPANVAVVLESFARSSQNIEHQAPRQRPSTGEFINGPGEPSANVSPMPVRRDWLLLAARALLAVSLIPVAFICYALWYWNDATAVVAGQRTWYSMLLTVCLSTASGLVYGLRKYNSLTGLTTAPGKAPPQTQAKPSRWIPMFLSLTAVAALFAAALFAGLIFYIQTDHGVVRVEVSDPTLQVSINDHTITMKDGDEKTLTIRPGEETLIVRKDDANFEFETDGFQIRRGDKIAFKVELVKGEIVVLKDDGPFERAPLLVGEWVGAAEDDHSLRLKFDANGKFEGGFIHPAMPQLFKPRLIGTYTADFSVSPAQLDLDCTSIYPAFDPKSEPEPGYDGYAEGAPAVEGPERERIKKHRFEAIIELVDANTLHMSELEDDTRPKRFGEESIVLHRQGVTKVDLAPHQEPAEAASISDGIRSPDGFEFTPELSKALRESGQSFTEFRKTLHTTLSRAAGIPNEQWEKTGKGLGTDAIQGTPLSQLLLMGAPLGDSPSSSAPAPRGFRMLTSRVPKPLELHKAMALSQSHGYVSLIQPEYIIRTSLDVDPKTRLLKGTVWFEASDFYAGKVDYAIEFDAGRMKVIEFELPDLGMKIVRNEDLWVRAPASSKTGKKDNEAIQGPWQVLYMEENGNPVPDAIFEKIVFVIKGDQLTTLVDGEELQKSTFTLNPDASPGSIDLVAEENEKLLGIYELQGDVLRICLADRQASERPGAFASDGKGAVLYRLKRMKSKDQLRVGSFYATGSIQIKDIASEENGQVRISYTTMAETMWFCPGANAKVTEQGVELTFARAWYDKRPKVDYPAAPAAKAGGLEKAIVVDPEGKSIFIRSGETVEKIWEPHEQAPRN